MNGTAHSSYSFLIYSLVSVVFLGETPTMGLCVLSLLFGMIPDIDGMYWKVKNKSKKTDNSFQHHLYYPTHWPITYTPLVAWTIITYFIDFYVPYFLALVVGIYGGHLLFDSISCGDGMNWLAPWGKKFVNLFSSTTDGYHGPYWSTRYRRTIFFKLENIAAIASILLLVIFYCLRPKNEILLILGILVVASNMIGGFMPIEKEYENEPPGGRYNDYRKLPEYQANLSAKQKERIRNWEESHPIS
ncbi:MAG: metal-dependent hydrolase [Candidatus Hodarchaeota archaeon]